METSSSKPHTFKPMAEKHPLHWVAHELDRAYPLVGQLDRLLFANSFQKDLPYTHKAFVHAPLGDYSDKNYSFGDLMKPSKFKYSNVEIASYPEGLENVGETDIDRKIVIKQSDNGKKHIILEGENKNGVKILATIEFDMVGNEADGYKPLQKLIGLGVSGADAEGALHAAYIYPQYDQATGEFSSDVEIWKGNTHDDKVETQLLKGDAAKAVAQIEKEGDTVGLIQIKIGNSQVFLPIPLALLDQNIAQTISANTI